jgi:hypothetical protein
LIDKFNHKIHNQLQLLLLLHYRNLQLEKVAAVNTSASSEGWLELNVTDALAAWLAAPADNRGFFITIHPHSQPGTLATAFGTSAYQTPKRCLRDFMEQVPITYNLLSPAPAGLNCCRAI